MHDPFAEHEFEISGARIQCAFSVAIGLLVYSAIVIVLSNARARFNSGELLTILAGFLFVGTILWFYVRQRTTSQVRLTNDEQIEVLSLSGRVIHSAPISEVTIVSDSHHPQLIVDGAVESMVRMDPLAWEQLQRRIAAASDHSGRAV